MSETMMTREEFDRLWQGGQHDKIWSREKAIALLEEMARYPNGNKSIRAAARRELRALSAPCKTR
ncbi:hypothetical protein [Pandoraea anhela]|uniref:Uncharacterized protein n=1 Tax=Pandoraea anhela TaxID=2508295 RepID=A0A5E4TLL3_9BURK|nr:hypothetical protein [Pandoraea anhela]VVD87398.1 hypothetical protein PAN31108_01448 [Pandoraea anhela]